jgi:tetratricopeptide (TPR) repeat protein
LTPAEATVKRLRARQNRPHTCSTSTSAVPEKKSVKDKEPPHDQRSENLETESVVADQCNEVSRQAAALDQEGNSFFEKGEYDQAFLRYEKALTLKRSIMEDFKPRLAATKAATSAQHEASLVASVATSINNMTYLKQRAGQASAEESLASYLRALQMKREILGPDHLSVGKTLNNIGSVFYLKREFEPALKAYQDAHVILAKQLGASHLDVGTIISNIGDVYAAMGERSLALENYHKALDIRWTTLGKQDPKVVRLMQQVASLETGSQPQKPVGDLSDSEDEEFAREDRARHEVIQKEVKTLKKELAEDMKFFDLMERQMAIDMVKDKTRIFREMHDLDKQGKEVGKNSETKSSTDLEDSFSSVPGAASPNPMPTIPHSPVIAAVNAQMERRTPMKSSPRLETPKSTKSLSAQERNEALSSVRTRLAKLRNDRAAAGKDQKEYERKSYLASLQQKKNEATPRRHYMDATASSAAKSSYSLSPIPIAASPIAHSVPGQTKIDWKESISARRKLSLTPEVAPIDVEVNRA